MAREDLNISRPKKRLPRAMLEDSGQTRDNSVEKRGLLTLYFKDLAGVTSAREAFERSFCCQVINLDRTRSSLS